MEENLTEIARRLRRDARQRAPFREGGVRRLEGWKLALSFAAAADDEATVHAEQAMRASFSDAFVEAHPLFGKKPDGATFDKWHLTAAWWRPTPSTEPQRARLLQLLIELGIPDEYRQGHEATAVYTPGIPCAPATHWMWSEPVETKLQVAP